jgi:hypothetical protein
MPSATVPDQYATIGAILDPPYFSLDTTFNEQFAAGEMSMIFAVSLPIRNKISAGAVLPSW